MFTKILLCTDGSDDARNAAAAAIEIAQKFESQIILISVFNPAPALAVPITGGPGLVPYIDTGVIQAISDEFHTRAEQSTIQMLEEGKAPYTVKHGYGHPVDGIVNAAEEENIDLIVMGSKGMGDFKRFLIGSISDGVLHHAHCPVLIVR